MSEVEAVEILRAHMSGTPDAIYLVNLCFDDGSSVIVEDKPTHAEAVVSALEEGVPIYDMTRSTRGRAL